MQINNYDDFIQKLYSEINKRPILNEELKKHTYFRIGGPADLFFEPESIDELSVCVRLASSFNIPIYIIGNGTNLLVSDKGFRGLIIKVANMFSTMDFHGDVVVAGGGALLSTVASKSATKGLTGLEFASGIPGFVGGALAMNAGAYGGEMKDVVISAKCMDLDGNIYEYTNEELDLTYRNSKVSRDGLIVVSVNLQLEVGNANDICSKIEELTAKRINSQPLDSPSAGSTFKRPNVGYAAKLIEDIGFKGYIHKGAMVSAKHSGFVVNHNNATCNEVLELIELIQKKVYDRFEIELEPEVKIIGEF